MTKQLELGEIYLSFRNALIRAISHIVPPRDIEDIVQETYVRVCQVEQKENIKYPRSFLLKTAKNLALDYVKSAGNRLNLSIDENELEELVNGGEGCNETYRNAVAKEEFALFCEAVRCLPAQCRRAFVLKKVYGFSQKEIAEYMNISESTVEKHIANGIKRCSYYMTYASGQSGPDKKKIQKLTRGGGS